MSKASIMAVTAVTTLILSVPAIFSVAAPAIGASSSYTPPGGGAGGGGNGGDLPTPSDDEKVAQLTETCNAALGTLVKIPAAMVESFAGGVNVVPVCNSGLGHKVAVDNSQAAPLQGVIADNSALAGPLGKNGFKPGDVVGVVLINGQATLYVHTGA